MAFLRPVISIGMTSGFCCWLALGAGLALAPLRLPAVAPLAAAVPAGRAKIITDPAWIWAMPTAMKSVAHPLRIEGRVSYYDSSYRLFWLERDGIGTYVQLGSPAPIMKIGQYVRIEGSVVPAKGLEAERVSVQVLRDYEPIKPLETEGHIGDITAFGGRVVTTGGYVDGQQLIDAEHVRLTLVVENRPVVCWFKPDDPAAPLDWNGKFVRITGLYSGRFDPTETQTTIELWAARQADLKVLGSIVDSPRFDLSPTPVNEVYRLPEGTIIRIRGLVEAHTVGTSMVVRDTTGQITLRSIQQQRIPLGTEVEAVGRIALSGSQWILESALYRPAPGTAPVADGSAPPKQTMLKTADQIRRLGSEAAAEGRPVDISGMVTWSMAGTDFFYLQDVSGGVRVRYPRDRVETPALGKYLRVEGSTYDGGFTPSVALKTYTDLGSMSPPTARPVTFEQAITGRENGQWVEMRGFIQSTVSDHDSRWIHVTTPSGEFVGRLESPVNFVANPGSLIRVHGVCETPVDQKGHITGVTLHVPFLHDIAIEEDAPADVYALPLRSIKSVSQLSADQTMTRVRVEGVVLHAMPGHYLYVQGKGVGLLLLSHETAPLAPGDRIEAVGILGREGVRTVLREAVFRKIGASAPPAAVPVENPAQLSTDLDSRLVRLRGTLLDVFRRPDHIRLTMQAGGTLFEATLDEPAGRKEPLHLQVGSGLELTGIYKLVFDDSRGSRGFQLQLRSADDVAIYRPARFWTIPRALAVAAVFGACLLLGLGWIAALRRRVRKQTAQIRAQLERQARLEAEVQRAVRLESLGTLAGGIAHDFNNLLTIVLGNLSLAMLDERTMEASGEQLRAIERGSLRARDLTRQLLTFAKGGAPQRTALSLPDLVRQAVDLVLRGTPVRAEYDLPPGLWAVLGDKDQLVQAIRHLVLNAVQAMPDGGVIRVSFRNQEMAADAKHGLAAGRHVRLTLTDTGGGIDPKVLPRIFDPYFSTKKDGTGLGLATVYSIVKKHHGSIEAESQPGAGATFCLWLPATAGTPLLSESAPVEKPPPLPAVLPAPSAPPANRPGRTDQPDLSRRRVLVMDDEESIRRILEIVLERMGFDPIMAADGSAAMREFNAAREAGRPVNLIVLDLTIPGGMGGRQVIELIRKIDPAVPAIVSSGYSNDPVMANFSDYGFQAVVQKPYDVTQLSRVIDQLLDRDTSRT
jgi:signal transduction histidine kinase/CheY-like chemotaxis protein